jgi:hypothetical protein
MTRRGILLRELASRYLDARTMEHMVDPAIADRRRLTLFSQRSV